LRKGALTSASFATGLANAAAAAALQLGANFDEPAAARGANGLLRSVCNRRVRVVVAAKMIGIHAGVPKRTETTPCRGEYAPWRQAVKPPTAGNEHRLHGPSSTVYHRFNREASMRNGRCTHCGCETVHAKPKSVLGCHLGVKIGVWGYAQLYPYVCTTCGYTELYVLRKSQLAKIAEKWPRVRPEAAPEPYR
jgi:hypothetical protein